MLSGSGQFCKDNGKQAPRKPIVTDRQPQKTPKRKRSPSNFFGERLKARKVTVESCSSKSERNSIAISGNDADDENTVSQSQTDLNAYWDGEYSVRQTIAE